MKTHFWSGQKRNLVGFALAAVMGAAGCNVIKPPEPEPTPTPATKPTKPVFTPTDYVTHWPEGKRPGLFRISNVINGDTVQIQSVSVVNTAPTPTPLPEGAPLPPGGAPTPAAGGIAPGQKVTFGVPETVRLAGIVAPSAGQPGYQGSVNTVLNWTKNNTVNPYIEVEDDPQYKFDEDGYRNVQIFFKGRTEATKNTEYLLNRMMVRSGWALVDKHTATKAPLDGWLNDQEYARTARLGLWKNNDTLNWVYKALQVPRPRVVLPPGVTNAKPGSRQPAAKTTSRATTTTTATRATTATRTTTGSTTNPASTAATTP